MTKSTCPQSWWTDDRARVWERLDDAVQTVIEAYDDDHLVFGLSLYAHAPNPHGITAEISPDEWYVSLPYEGGLIDVEVVASLLSEELGLAVTVQERSDEWEHGYWLLVEELEQAVMG